MSHHDYATVARFRVLPDPPRVSRFPWTGWFMRQIRDGGLAEMRWRAPVGLAACVAGDLLGLVVSFLLWAIPYEWLERADRTLRVAPGDDIQ